MGSISVVYHLEGNSWWANSEQVSGFHVGGDSLTKVREQVRIGLPFFLEVSKIEYFEQTDTGKTVGSQSYRVFGVSNSVSGDLQMASAGYSEIGVAS